jgi:hypothetical protein
MTSVLSKIPLLSRFTTREWEGPQLSVVVRGGQLRLLMVEQRKIVWYRVIPLNPSYLEGGMIAQPRAVAASFRAALEQSPAPLITEGVAAVGGYHALSSIIDVPNAREFNPQEIIPREARRLFSYRPDSSSLSWWPIKSDGTARRFLFVVTRRAAMQSLRELFAMTGLRLVGLDSGPLAVAAAANLEEGVVVQAEADGGDVVVIKGGTVGLVRSAFWGGDIIDQDSLLSRVADLTERAIASHNDANAMGPVSVTAPLYLFGAGAEMLGEQVGESVGRPMGTLEAPLTVPEEMPIGELAANLGMALRWAK